MVTTPVHARLRLGGTLYGDAAWSVGILFADKNGDDPFSAGIVDVPGHLQAWVDAVRALHTNTVIPDQWKNALSQEGTLDYIRASRVGPDGRETDVALTQLAQKVTGAGTGRLPAQSAIVLSLQTGRPGASYRGRLYLPACGVALEGGRMTASAAQSLATDSANFLNDVANATGDFGGIADIKPSVVSTVRQARTPIASVRVGNRLDSQRRRAESEEEVYRVAAVPQ